jgi:tetratricopeptide (TPR) repeat protein
MSEVSVAAAPRRPRPVVGPRLRRLLAVVFGLFGLLAVNGFYLGSITALEWFRGEVFQDYFYQLMFLAHLLLGLLVILPVVVFGALHLRNAWHRPNRAAVRAGLGVYVTALVLLASGIILTRFDFFEVKDPDVRTVAYWLHVATPFVVAWLFVLHRLAGRAIRWRVGAAWAALALALPVAMLTLSAPDAGEETLDAASYTGQAFRPALANTADGELIPARALMMDDYCQECHADAHEQWAGSAHRLSSFNNPAYLFSVRETRKVVYERDGNTRISRFCAGCHDPVPLFSGAFDDPNFDDVSHPTAHAGVTCSVCHAITRVDSPMGNADFTIEEPVHYPFAYSDNTFLRWVNRQLVKAKPEFHKKVFLKPVHRSPEFCGTCHKVHLPEALNQYKWLRGQNHFDAYTLSGVSGHGASSFYYPEHAVDTCAQCHMPLTASDDFAAAHFDDSGLLKVHDHQFPAANTALPHLLGLPEDYAAKHRAFLSGALRVDIFGVKEGGTITGELSAPLRPEVPTLEPGKRYLLEVVVRTLKVGHLFTQGTADSNQVWLEADVEGEGRPMGKSGGLARDGRVDPWSHFVNAYVVDRDGNRIDRRNAQDIFTSLYNHQIPPGAADVVHYAFTVPEQASGPITVAVALNYRKFDTRYVRYFEEDPEAVNDLPITVIASDRITFPVAGGPPAAGQDSPIPTWQRWNDYGIALLRKGKRGELRQAEAAFERVEAMGRADGPLNLARAYLREGRLDDAVAALTRAAEHPDPAYPWVVAWLTGLVNKQNGYLDAAIADFERVLATDFAEARARGFDFSRDYRVINELGQTLVERSKRERGPARREARDAYLTKARDTFRRTLALEPENATAHYNLTLIHTLLGETELAEHHRALHELYRPDDNAAERAVTLARRKDPAADHAAEAVVIYDLQRPGAYGLAGPMTVAEHAVEEQ